MGQESYLSAKTAINRKGFTWYRALGYSDIALSKTDWNDENG